MIVYSFIFYAALFLVHVSAQYYPPKPEGLNILESRFRSGVTISYKQVSSLVCGERETVT